MKLKRKHLCWGLGLLVALCASASFYWWKQTAKVHQVMKFLLDLFFKFNWHESVAALSVADFWELIKNYEEDKLDMTFGYPRIAGSNS